MAQKSSNSVALERRMDLASLFCMIGRHGPAVAVAVVATLSVLVAFIIYRSLRRKRRKAAAAEDDAGSRGADRDAPLIRPEVPLSHVESTDDEGSSDTKEATDLIPSHPKIRLRRVAAEEKTPPPCSPPKIDFQVPDCRHATSDDTEVFKADYQKAKNVTTDQDVSDEKNGQEEENFQCASNNLTNTVECNVAEPVNHIGDLPASFICYGKTKTFEEENHPDSINHTHYINNQLCVEDEKNEVEVAVEATEVLDKDHLNKFTAAKFDTHPPVNDKHEVEIKQKQGAACSEEDGVPPVAIHQVKKKMLTSDNTAHTTQRLDENVSASVMTEGSCLVRPTICQDQQSEHMENNEVFETRADSATDAAACDKGEITATIMSEEISHPDTLSSFQDQQSDQMQNDDLFSEVTVGAAPVVPKDIHSPFCKINALSFDQSKLRDKDKDSVLFPGVGEESGISSMTVSPDLQDGGNEFNVIINNMVLPAVDFAPQPERTETQRSLFADDVALSVIEDTASMMFGPYPTHLSQKPHSEPTDWAKYESFAANEDIFGHEIEDRYHSAVDEFMAQIAESVTSFTSEMTTKTAIKGVVEFVEVKESKEGASSERKVELDAEIEKEDFDKTEISIMEATMDNNEWIMDSNYQVLPWMNVSVPSFVPDNKKATQLPSEEQQHSSSLPDAISLSTEVKQTNPLSVVEDVAENSKKVVAVQPMPQNVNVTFRIHYLTHSPYQTVAITGNQQELGNWKEFIPLERAKDGHWVTAVSLPAESHVEWKFVVVDKGQVCRWEECGNRLLDTGYGDDLIVHKWWGFL